MKLEVLNITVLLLLVSSTIPPIEDEAEIWTCLQVILSKISSSRVLFMYNKIFPTMLASFTATILKLQCEIINRLDQFGAYVIIGDDLEDLDWTLGKVYQESTFNASAIVVAVYFGDDLEGMFELLWKYYLVNVLVLVEGHGVYSYYPISQGGCKHLNITYLGTCTANISEWESRAIKFSGCTIRANIFVSPPFVNAGSLKNNTGLDMMIMKVLMQRLNFKVLYLNHTYPHWGQKHQNGYSLGFKDLHQNKIDMLLGGCSLDDRVLGDFAIILTQCNINLHFFVPLARQVASWMNIFIIFKWRAWLGIFASLLVTTLVWWLLKGGNALVILEMLISVTYKKPKKLHLQAIFATWAVAALVLSSSYQSLTMAFLYKPMYAHQISTLKQMVDSGMDFGGVSLAKSLFEPEEAPIFKKIVQNWHSCPLNPTHCYTRMAVDQDFSLFKNTRYINVQNSINKTRHFYKLKDGFMLILTIYMTKGIPMQRRMQELILRMRDVGLINKWDLYTKFTRYTVFNPRAKELALPQLASTFVLFGCGILFACLVFIWEVLR